MNKQLLIAAGLAAMVATSSAWAGHADYCLEVVKQGSGRALKNTCGETVEATWCFNPGCRYDNSWTIAPGQEMPLADSHSVVVMYAACRGANSIKSFSPMVGCR